MDPLQLVASTLSGGLAGGCVSTFFNRKAYRRSLRTQFEPQLNNMFAAYFLRMQSPEGRYWVTRVGYVEAPEDKAFVDHRTNFFFDLVKYNELREVRKLHRAMTQTINPDRAKEGEITKTDLTPDFQALSACLAKIHKKLGLS